MEQELFFKGHPFTSKFAPTLFLRFKQRVNSATDSAGKLECSVYDTLPDNCWVYDSYVRLSEITSEHVTFRATIAGQPTSVTVRFEDMIAYEAPAINNTEKNIS